MSDNIDENFEKIELKKCKKDYYFYVPNNPAPSEEVLSMANR